MKKYRFSEIILLTASLIVSGCSKNNPQPSGDISVFDAKSVLIGTAKLDPEHLGQFLPELKENIITAPLTTYHLKNKGDIPYVEATQLASALNETLKVLVTTQVKAEVKDKLLYITSKDNKGEMILNAETDEVKLKNSQSFTLDITKYNNGVAGDYCSFRENSIKDSEETHIFKADGSKVHEYETYSFKDYGFDIYETGNKYYVPFEAVTKLMYRDVGVDFAYNGKEFYLNKLGNFVQTRIYSSNGYFKNYTGVFAPSKDKAQGEAYRFYYPYSILKEGSETEFEPATKFYVFAEDHTATFVACKGTTLDYSKTIESEDSKYTYTWSKEGDLLFLKIVDNGTPLGEYQIHLDETRFLKGTVSNEVSEYNYNILRFLFDNVYGLKKIKGYKNAEEYFTSLGVKDGLKNTNVSEYNKALAKLIGNVDDGHTSYDGLSLFTKYEETDGLIPLMKSNLKDRVLKLFSDREKYSKSRIDTYKKLYSEEPGVGDTQPNFYQGMRFSSNKETAVITFDLFTHATPTILNMRELFPTEQSYGDDMDMLVRTRAKMIDSSPDGFSQCFDILKHLNKESNVVKNVVVNLTLNGGGMIAALPYLEAFFSDKPSYTLIDTLHDEVRDYRYKVDLNGDGTFGGEGDTFKGKFNFFFLTSSYSFSCGNFLPGFAKDNGIKVIGEKSGGGTSPVGVFLEALGSAINLSNYTNMAYKGADGKYIHNDAGIPVDFEFPLKDGNWYDPNEIQTFIKSLSN